MEENKVGRPLKFKTVEELQTVIDEYFDWCDNRTKKIWDDKNMKEYMITDPAPYTMSGLARRIGLSRQALMEYSHKDEFGDAIKAARQKIEEDVETRMNSKDTFTPGLIFNAKNNFGWKDKTETDITTDGKPLIKFDERITNYGFNQSTTKAIDSVTDALKSTV